MTAKKCYRCLYFEKGKEPVTSKGKCKYRFFEFSGSSYTCGNFVSEKGIRSLLNRKKSS